MRSISPASIRRNRMRVISGSSAPESASCRRMAVIFSIIMALVYRLRDRTLIWQKGLLK